MSRFGRRTALRKHSMLVRSNAKLAWMTNIWHCSSANLYIFSRYPRVFGLSLKIVMPQNMPVYPVVIIKVFTRLEAACLRSEKRKDIPSPVFTHRIPLAIGLVRRYPSRLEHKAVMSFSFPFPTPLLNPDKVSPPLDWRLFKPFICHHNGSTIFPRITLGELHVTFISLKANVCLKSHILDPASEPLIKQKL